MNHVAQDRDEPIDQPNVSKDRARVHGFQSFILWLMFAFVFKQFIAETYVIPTGSMAPTLYGAHLMALAPQSGYRFPVNYREMNPTTGLAAPLQGVDEPIVVPDPMLRSRRYPEGSRNPPAPSTLSRVKTRIGDRIFVHRLMYSLVGPSRFDVIVFKNPATPAVNMIKRLIGLPNEVLWLADGDVFARPRDADRDRRNEIGVLDTSDPAAWNGFEICRKPEHVQRTVWQPVYSSAFIPVDPDAIIPRWQSPWKGTGPDWEIEGRRSYTYGGSGPTTLTFDTALMPIVDRYPYNDSDPPTVVSARQYFDVSDIRLAAAVRPENEGFATTIRLIARGHVYEVAIADREARVSIRPVTPSTPAEAGAEGEDLETFVFNYGFEPFPAGEITEIEFWHVDQSIRLWIGGREAGTYTYEWDARTRLRHATGVSVEEAAQRSDADRARLQQELTSLQQEIRAYATSSNAETWDDFRRDERGRTLANRWMILRAALDESGNIYATPDLQSAPTRLEWDFSGGPFVLHRVELDRDLYYRPTVYPLISAADDFGDRNPRAGQPALATSPTSLAVLGPDQFFAAGDNSPASSDSRLWEPATGWVEQELESEQGIVPRELLLGKAFFVYYPSPEGLSERSFRFVPGFGRLRWIR